ncbi:MAG: hypothetical protein FWH14_02800 [Oscillospiraceae bacterium]|nr:hypothetical protein [Oscillospiraceae bacterium]
MDKNAKIGNASLINADQIDSNVTKAKQEWDKFAKSGKVADYINYMQEYKQGKTADGKNSKRVDSQIPEFM